MPPFKYEVILTGPELTRIADVLIKWEVHQKYEADNLSFECIRDTLLKDANECKDLREMLLSRARCVI